MQEGGFGKTRGHSVEAEGVQGGLAIHLKLLQQLVALTASPSCAEVTGRAQGAQEGTSLGIHIVQLSCSLKFRVFCHLVAHSLFAGEDQVEQVFV